MQGEQSRHCRAPPDRSRQPSENPKDQQSVSGVQPKIGAVEPDRVQTIDGIVQLQRHPGQRVPKTGPIGPCPANAVSSQPGEHLGIGCDVNIVVIIDEIAGVDPTESQQSEPKQSQTDHDFGTVFVGHHSFLLKVVGTLRVPCRTTAHGACLLPEECGGSTKSSKISQG